MEIRSPQLAPLSKEHKEGLEYLSRIRRGLASSSPEQLLQYIRWYWKNHIKPHFFQEERILLPYLPANHPLAQKLTEEHAYIRDLILSLDRNADKHEFKLLCDLIEKHIAFEERELFTYLEETLAAIELARIQEQLDLHPVPHGMGEWNDHPWEAP